MATGPTSAPRPFVINRTQSETTSDNSDNSDASPRAGMTVGTVKSCVLATVWADFFCATAFAQQRVFGRGQYQCQLDGRERHLDMLHHQCAQCAAVSYGFSRHSIREFAAGLIIFRLALHAFGVTNSAHAWTVVNLGHTVVRIHTRLRLVGSGATYGGMCGS